MDIKSNTLKNEQHYDQMYNDVNVDHTIRKLNNIDAFITEAKQIHTSWVGMYYNDFEKTLKGKKVLELGCGDCQNSAIMSVFGAEVYANDISQNCGDIISAINNQYKFDTPIKFVHGDFLYADLPSDFFDIVVGKAFVHHLTNEQEILFTEKIVKILKPDGTVRYFEPAVNSVILDKLRFMMPVPGRPSSFQKEKFKIWKANDPHPERDNSSGNYRKIGRKYFEKTEIYCIGSIERLHRILPSGNINTRFRKAAFKIERMLPRFINEIFARGQLVIYKNPK